MTLSSEAADALLAAPPAYTVLYRPASGGRWRTVGTAPDLPSAIRLIVTAGDWWLRQGNSACEDGATGPHADQGDVEADRVS